MHFLRHRRPARAVKPDSPFRPRLEALEDRYVPSALTVTTLSDTGVVSGDGSLRGEIMAANGIGDTIQFAPTLKGGTIKLNSMLDINKPLTIDGANNGITVSGGNQHVVFTIEPGFAVGINGLTITGGFTVGAGAGINNGGSLTLTNS